MPGTPGSRGSSRASGSAPSRFRTQRPQAFSVDFVEVSGRKTSTKSTESIVPGAELWGARVRRAVVPTLGVAALLLLGLALGGCGVAADSKSASPPATAQDATTEPAPSLRPAGPSATPTTTATDPAGSAPAPSAGASTAGSPTAGPPTAASPSTTAAPTRDSPSAPPPPSAGSVPPSATAARPPSSTGPAPAPTTPAPPGPSGPAEPSAAGPAPHRDPGSTLVLVNKRNPLRPADWAPADLVTPDVPATREGLALRAEAAAAAEELFSAAAADGVDLSLVSAYRSYGYQRGTYAGWVQQHGRAGADRVSARPGHSEHQTGLALDVGARDGACTLQTCFEDTPAGRWVAEHAAEHGFVVRYPAGAEAVTGYSYEPWHLRYLGTAEAVRVEAAGGVLETAWGFPAAPRY